MNKKVMNYIKEKKNKVKDLVEEKKEDATRYANERINAVKEYMEKNGKKIKKSATALALAGLTTLSATTMSGCEKIGGIIGTDTDYTHETHFSEPNIDIDSIDENALTGEQVLALYDSIVWSDQVDGQKSTGYYSEEDEVSAQFEKITSPSGLGYGYFWDSNGEIYDRQMYCNQEQQNLYRCYSILIEYSRNVNGRYCEFDREHDIFWRTVYTIYKDSFEPVAELLGKGSRVLTTREWEKNETNGYSYRTTGSDQLIGCNVYYPFEITREDILNANQEQLKALYNMYQNIIDINFKFQYSPEILVPEPEPDFIN